MERQAIVECIGPGTARRQVQPSTLTGDQSDEIGGCPGRIRKVQLAGKAAHAGGEVCEDSTRLPHGDQSGQAQHSCYSQTRNDPAEVFKGHLQLEFQNVSFPMPPSGDAEDLESAPRAGMARP
jgi:hypothetical protein